MRDPPRTGKVLELPRHGLALLPVFLVILVAAAVSCQPSSVVVAAAAFLTPPQQPQPRVARHVLVRLNAETKKKSIVPTRSKLTPAQRLLQKNAEAKGGAGDSDATMIAPFDSVKEALYFVGDNLGKISSPSKTKENGKVYDGYQAGAAANKKKGQSPVQQILLARPSLLLNKPADTSDTSDSSSPPATTTTSTTATPAAKERQPKASVFDNFKETMFQTADLVSNQPRKKSTTFSSDQSMSPVQRMAGAASGDEFKPAVVRPPDRILVDAGVSLPDLQSDNPFIRVAAEWKLRNAQIRQNAQETRQNLESAVDAVKESVYKAGEVAQKTATEVERLPDRSRKLVNDVRSFVQAIPGVVEDTVDTITAIPKEVEQKVSQTVEKTVQVVDEVKSIPTKVQRSAAETVDKTVRVVDEVKAIPGKVQRTAEITVETTTKVINDVKAFPSKVQQTVDDIVFNTKVLLGQEKPRLKPKPPASPPKEEGDMAWRVAGTVAKTVGEAAWFVTKGTAQLGWKAAEAGLGMAQEQLAQQQKAKQSTGGSSSSSSSTMSAPTNAVKPPPPKVAAPARVSPLPSKSEAPKVTMAPPPKLMAPPKKETTKESDAVKAQSTPVVETAAEIDLGTAELDAQIAEALEAAKSALKKPFNSEDSNESSGNRKTMD